MSARAMVFIMREMSNLKMWRLQQKRSQWDFHGSEDLETRLVIHTMKLHGSAEMRKLQKEMEALFLNNMR